MEKTAHIPSFQMVLTFRYGYTECFGISIPKRGHLTAIEGREIDHVFSRKKNNLGWL